MSKSTASASASATPDASLEATPSNKRQLSSPFSPEDFPKKKLNLNMSGTDTSDLGEYSSQEHTLTQSQTAMLTLPPSGLQQMSELIKPSIYGDILGEIRNDLRAIVKSAVSEAIDEKLDHLKSENDRLTRENVDLKKRVSKLETAMDETEQYSRRNSLRISKIPESQDENTDHIVLKVAETVGVNISPSDIDRSHRVGKYGNNLTRDILVKFGTYRARERLIKSRKHLKGSDLDGVFINEDLTKIRSQLLYEARKCVKSEQLLGAWSSDGRILIKNLKEKVSLVTCVAEIETAILKAESESVNRGETSESGMSA